eukprot:Protomagalhaensia_wolfi_Nauph_80__405@NODE_1223_length_1648_cov_202_423244_g941_i0_p1_GENE_NODE_1223_length_1648_cov_202_423244_g941_i0NODE_1223_length_1648_cov_202_423244_g941_i0_p1_ORF_typecomplete_len262_score46_11YscOlike/PF16789_5/0_0029Ribosomal_L30_N/PF08079_12/0_017YtxC/PF08812_11/0_14Peptidase_C50/PF03568_17/0_61_NODE_1223_length_1648_cov_202_423244_g941_i08611616
MVVQEEGGSLLRVKNSEAVVKDAETVLKNRKRDFDQAASRAAKLERARKAAKKQLRAETPISLESIIKTRLDKFLDKKRYTRVSNRRFPPRLFKPEDESRIILVVKNKKKAMSYHNIVTLKSWGVLKPGTAAFVPNTPEIVKQLKLADYLVYYGHPTAEQIRDLILKKGYMTDGKALTSNLLVEEAFGAFGILSVDDLIHQIYTCGPAFPAVREKMESFKLGQLQRVEQNINTKYNQGYQTNLAEVLKLLV